jgi:DNA-binding transcriptional regulator YiaG
MPASDAAAAASRVRGWDTVTNSVIHGRGLERARRLRGLTVEECAARAGVSPDRWRVWEAGQDWPTEVTVLRVFPRVGRESLMRLGAAGGEG